MFNKFTTQQNRTTKVCTRLLDFLHKKGLLDYTYNNAMLCSLCKKGADDIFTVHSLTLTLFYCPYFLVSLPHHSLLLVLFVNAIFTLSLLVLHLRSWGFSFQFL